MQFYNGFNNLVFLHIYHTFASSLFYLNLKREFYIS